jgi:hypothetical protein
MRADAALLFCDGEEGFCGAWDLDYYAQTCSAVDGVRITLEVRAPGWTSVGDEDFCPEHMREAWPEGTEIPFRSDGSFGLPEEGVLVIRHMPEPGDGA